jgi:hypothetical protein
MKYLLRKAVLDNVPEIEITAEEYAEFAKAHNILSSALAIEETYEILITNYLEFEKQILNTTAGYMVRDHFDYSDFFEVHLGLNIRLVNLHTAARLYKDQLPHNVPVCVPHVADAKAVVEKLFSKEYDENKEYRFMDALRNHVQHRGLAIHATQPGSRWTSLEADGLMEYSMELASLRSYLEENPRFNQKVLSELEDKIDLKGATRRYMESMSNVHESARSMIAASVTLARELIEDAHRRYAAIHNEHLGSLSACQWSNERQISAIPLVLDWDNIRVKLQQRNRKLTNLSKRYVTGSIKPDHK